jgi:hypothetical protein
LGNPSPAPLMPFGVSRRICINQMKKRKITQESISYYPTISWEHYLINRSKLRQNLGQFAEPSGVPRQGEALLQGIAFCAHCGRRMAK